MTVPDLLEQPCNKSSKDMNLLEHSKVKSKATLGDRSFTVAAPKLWNNLPNALRNVSNVVTALNVS